MAHLKPDTEAEGVVFDIERFAVHDGHGIRTLVFLKGCPLKCQWCSNPESQSPKPQIGFFEDKCSACFRCAEVCPYGDEFKRSLKIDWEKCKGCLKCVDSCLFGARVLYGRRMKAGEVVEIVKRDRTFYNNSGGGLTLGGGEATFQPDFAGQILKGCREQGIHTAMETCGFASWENFSCIIQYVDLLLFDIKNMDTAVHKQYTGAGNELILENAKKASEIVNEMIVRFPLIPDFNDGTENARKMGGFIRDSLPRVKRVDILPYHSVGESKNARIGRAYPFRHEGIIDDAKIRRLKGVLESFGLQVSVGG